MFSLIIVDYFVNVHIEGKQKCRIKQETDGTYGSSCTSTIVRTLGIRFKAPKPVASCTWRETTLILSLFQEESSKALGKNKKVRKDKKRSEH